MDMKQKAMDCMCRMDQIVLRPRITAAVRCQDMKKGSLSGEKSVTWASSFTLLQGVGMMAGMMMILYFMGRIWMMKREKKYREKYQKKLKRAKEKMKDL